MADGFDDIHDLENLSDDELRRLVTTHLADNNSIDADDISVETADGRVRLSGRVGTDGERRIAERILSDVIGVTDYENEIVIDPIRRAESPEDIEEHLADEAEHEGLLLGDRPVSLSPEAEHLDEAADSRARAFGSTDVGETIARGVPWNPPTTPTPEGFDGSDAGPENMGGRH